MTQFRWNDRTFTLLERPLFAEAAWVERQAGVDIDDMTGSERIRALYLLSIRRADPPVMLRWEDTDEWSPADFDVIPDPPPVPTAPGGEAGAATQDRPAPPSKRSATSGGSRRSRTSVSTPGI